MNNGTGNAKWMLFLRNYELTDPEPDLGELIIGNGYKTKAVDTHMAWHRRLMDAWKKETICH